MQQPLPVHPRFDTQAANSWSIIAENVATEATGIAASDPNTVFMAGGQNGAWIRPCVGWALLRARLPCRLH